MTTDNLMGLYFKRYLHSQCPWCILRVTIGQPRIYLLPASRYWGWHRWWGNSTAPLFELIIPSSRESVFPLPIAGARQVGLPIYTYMYIYIYIFMNIRILLMENPISATAEAIEELVKLAKKQQLPHDALSISQPTDDARKAAVVLETSQQKYRVWRKTWMENVQDPENTAQELWGSAGWEDIRKLLGSIRDAVQRTQEEIGRPYDTYSGSKLRHGLRFLSKWKGQTGPAQTFTVKSPQPLDLAIQLNRSVDELWTYSEVAFDSLHGIFAQKINPPFRNRLLTCSLQARAGSLALYAACNRSKAGYSLEVDLFGDYGGNRRSSLSCVSQSSTKTNSRLYYHLFVQAPETSAYTGDMMIESVANPGEQDFGNTKPFEFDVNKNDLAIFESWPHEKSRLLSLWPNGAHAPSYFRVAKPPAALKLDGDIESIAHLIYKDRVTSNTKLAQRPLSLLRRVELAFKLVECGFYLLGTPWLASLSSKRLRRVEANGRKQFVLEVQTLELEDLYSEDPKALSEPSQLFSIGVLLVEIALSDPDQSNPVKIQDPELRKSKILPLVERAMGSLYSKATAFCLQDRRSGPHFGRPDKYQKPEETGWMSYLTELLEDYHAQVFSR